ncbi:MAG: hypothetical protein JJU36_17520 [Phycisphaeraceae bacterium]|nr:hypothetical protein [Phycisphaeraceae bacterium]
MFQASVIGNERICTDHYRLTLAVAAGFPPTLPGQFIQLGCSPTDHRRAMGPGGLDGRDIQWLPGEAPPLAAPGLLAPAAMLKRPFSLAGHVIQDDGRAELEIIHRVVGVGTAWLARLSAGDAVDLIGPLGNAFGMPEGRSIPLLVGGGVGIPPMYYLASWLSRRGYRGVGFIGAVSRDLIAGRLIEPGPAIPPGGPELGHSAAIGEFADHGFGSVVTTDDGSLGMRGRITDGLETWIASATRSDIESAAVFCCGSTPMMRSVAAVCARYGLPCQVCLEQAMACGMGTCQSCIVRLEPDCVARTQGQPARKPHGQNEQGRDWRYFLACTDGPVFDSACVLW